MKVVVDTNVFVSGVFWIGPPAAILQAWRDQRLEAILSVSILEEYPRVGAELSCQFAVIDLDAIIDLLTTLARIVADIPLPSQVCSDPDDDKFIAAALVGGARCVITGDRALLKLDGYAGLRMMTPRTFVRSHLGSSS